MVKKSFRFLVESIALVVLVAPTACTSKPPARHAKQVAPLSRVLVTDQQLELRESIYFETEKAAIKPVSLPVLAEVAEVLSTHPEIEVLRIEGHTDRRGPSRYNKKLSEKRAASVRQYLIEIGVPAERLRSEGYGEEKPIDPANNRAAWEKNRRVEMYIEKKKRSRHALATIANR